MAGSPFDPFGRFPPLSLALKLDVLCVAVTACDGAPGDSYERPQAVHPGKKVQGSCHHR